MILYFSGTGNSKYVAERLAQLLGEQLLNMEDNPHLPAMSDDEPLGIIFPVYAWGVPTLVRDYLSSRTFTNKFVWTAMTCGDDMGYADTILERIIRHPLSAAYSLQMPNTYVSLPGFDIDPSELAERKIRETESRLPHIAHTITRRVACRQLTRGGMAWMKTYVLRPLFNRFLLTDKLFRTTKDCTSCGLCASRCPAKDIVMREGTPHWQHTATCTGCLRCYHNCPRRAIEWGRFTKNKGQKNHSLHHGK